MKISPLYLILFFALLICNHSYSQSFSAQIIDSISKQPIDLATISFIHSNYIILSDSEGHFKIDSIALKEDLLISNIGYKSKKIKLSHKNENNIIFLSPDIEELKEILVFNTNKKINYSWDKFLKSKRGKTEYFGFQFDTEHFVFIENPYDEKGKIKAISLELSKLNGYIENKKQKIDYVASFNIKFYSYDDQKNKPGKEIYNKNIIIEPENKTYTLTIDLDSLHIPFPKNGVCVGVEIINTKYKNPIKTFAFIGPILNFYENRQFMPINSWIKYHNEEKPEFKTSISQDFKGKKYSTLIVDLVVNIEKH